MNVGYSATCNSSGQQTKPEYLPPRTSCLFFRSWICISVAYVCTYTCTSSQGQRRIALNLTAFEAALFDDHVSRLGGCESLLLGRYFAEAMISGAIVIPPGRLVPAAMQQPSKRTKEVVEDVGHIAMSLTTPCGGYHDLYSRAEVISFSMLYAAE